MGYASMTVLFLASIVGPRMMPALMPSDNAKIHKFLVNVL
jgi:hypothetical protein